MLLEKDKLNTIDVLISMALIDSYISHDEFGLLNNVLREYYEMNNCDGYQGVLASMVYKFFDKKTGSRAIASVNEQLAKELHKPVIKILKKRKVYARFTDNIYWNR